jgi:glyoxylase-like metal-dependent hydrolase (beta-lactamase superfamily II)
VLINRSTLKFLATSLLFNLALSAPSYSAVGDIGVYTSPVKSFSTASYWIEGVNGVVLIDTQFLPKDGIAALELAEKTTGKKVTTAIVLHPNPDKFNGTLALQQRGIKVITSAPVAALIPAVHVIRWGWFGEEFAPDYPRQAAKPDTFGDETVVRIIEGLELKLHVLGKGASGSHVVVQHMNNVFVGDLINPDNHAWLELGYVRQWLQRLDDIRAMNPSRIYPGRGKSGGAELALSQAGYLKQVQQWVKDELTTGDLGWIKKQLLQRKIENAYPSLGLPIFMRDGLAAVWSREQSEDK